MKKENIMVLYFNILIYIKNTKTVLYSFISPLKDKLDF